MGLSCSTQSAEPERTTVPRRDKEATRQLLLETGFELMLERGINPGWGVRVSEVTERVGLTTGAAYQIWNGSRTVHGAGGQDLFHQDLALYALDRIVSDASATHTHNVWELATAGASLDRIMQQFGATEWTELSEPSQFACFIAMLASAPSNPDLREASRDAYRASTVHLVDAYTKLFDHYGLEVVPPHTVEHVVTSVLALADGLCLRALIEPDAVPDDVHAPAGVADDAASGAWHLLSVGSRAIFTAMTRPKS